MKVDSFFEKYLKKDSIFKNKSYLSTSYVPETLDHRQKEIEFLSFVLAPALKNDRVSNLFIYGKTGTGKTVTVKYVARELKKVADKNDIPLKTVYVNCKLSKIADTEYRLLSYLLNFFGVKVPSTGLPTQSLYEQFFEKLDELNTNLILILDEIDHLLDKAGDELLYILLRKNEELKYSKLSIVGISNNLGLTQSLDPRIKSSLGEEEIVFESYNALQLRDILTSRAKLAFKEGVVAPGVIEKCAAYAAREHGDARRALDLLRIAGELVDRAGENKLVVKYLDFAFEKIESDKYVEMIKSQPKQFQAVMFCTIYLSDKNMPLFTGNVYDVYLEICKKAGLRPLTQRRISDIINELDLMGFLNVKVVSQGRYGRTREISLAYPDSLHSIIKGMLLKELGLD